MLNNEQKKILLNFTRLTIESYLKGKSLPGKSYLKNFPDDFINWNCGVFVTLYLNNKLKGCIGILDTKENIVKNLQEAAINSATKDYRFSAISLKDLPKVKIEISILSPFKKINDLKEITLGIHGIYVKKGYRSGLFLPQVAIEQHWDLTQTLNYLCAHKAGLAENAWKDKDTKIYIFTTEVIS